MIKQNNIDISVIIGSLNEGINLVHTIHSVINDLELTGMTWEIIVIDGGSEDYESVGFFLFKRDYTYSPRGMTVHGYVKFLHNPIYGNVLSRDYGIKKAAKGKYLVFVDAHVSIRPYTIKNCIETLEKFKAGIVQVPVAYFGAYPPKPGYQYTIRLGEKGIWGTWNKAKVSDEPFYTPGIGHCFLVTTREKYLKWQGYPPHLRTYGGGETYMNLKYWLMGETCMIDPRGLIYHSPAGRGYVFHSEDLIHNQMYTAYVLGGEKHAERALLTYLDKPRFSEELIRYFYEQILKEGEKDRQFVLANQKIDFEALIKGRSDKVCHDCKTVHNLRLWDILNEKLYKKHESYVVYFEDWLTRLKTEKARELYRNSEFQNNVQQDTKSKS